MPGGVPIPQGGQGNTRAPTLYPKPLSTRPRKPNDKSPTSGGGEANLHNLIGGPYGWTRKLGQRPLGCCRWPPRTYVGPRRILFEALCARLITLFWAPVSFAIWSHPLVSHRPSILPSSRRNSPGRVTFPSSLESLPPPRLLLTLYLSSIPTFVGAATASVIAVVPPMASLRNLFPKRVSIHACSELLN